MKKIRMILALLAVSVCSWQSAWAQDEVVVSVSLAQPGSLGYEILQKHDPINEVTDLTVTGVINDDDWNIMRGITNLKNLDLSGASCETMPANVFDRSSNICDADNLILVKLPSNLKSIGSRAFYQQYSLTDVYLPTTLEEIGTYCFFTCSNLESIHLSSLPNGITTIPTGCFRNCKKLQSFTIPEGVTYIGNNAFNGCILFKSTLPTTIQSIGSSAFDGASMEGIDVVLSENTSVDEHIFSDSKIQSITFPTTFYRTNRYGIISDCKELTDVYLKSPTCFTCTNGAFLSGCTNVNLKIHVPAHLLTTYKTDSYFKDYTIVGDATDDYTGLWTISAPLSLSYTRMPDNSNIKLCRSASLEVIGSTAQTFGNVLTYGHSSDYSQSNKYGSKDWSMIINTCDNVTITGTLEHKIQTYEKKWYFFCLPFDFKVGDIVTENNVKYAIRYYDGANRATTNAASSNWKNYDVNDIIPAGTGFIFQTSAETWVTFKAQDNASKQYVMSNNAFVKALADNDTEQAAHKGWNLVGNPWQSYYNIHKLSFTAPISVWTGSTYAAYSLIDDDYAIRPNEAFFVQSPGSSSITFPTDGRQLTEEITSQNGARKRSASNRQLVDIQIKDENQMTDKTRLVVNPDACLSYEVSCDASKFMSMDANVPQIYSLGIDDTQYAINERPADSGVLRLGIVTMQEGQYTISAIRNTLGEVLLKDYQTGLTTDLSQNNYSFDAEVGVNESRFTLTFAAGGATGISKVTRESHEMIEVFTLDGRKVNNSTEDLKQGVYVVRKGQKAQKMIIK